VEAGEIDWTKVFSIDIDIRDNVSFLQQAIIAAQEPLFDEFSVYELALFKVSIFRDPNVREGRFQAIDLGQRILPLERLLQLFPRVKKDELELQIVIQLPIDGELVSPVCHIPYISHLSLGRQSLPKMKRKSTEEVGSVAGRRVCPCFRSLDHG
jgi:hypothetical protein